MKLPVPEPLKHAARAILPERWYRQLRRQRGAVGQVRFGDLRRLEPLSRQFGYDRGTPIDRYYIESFLAARADRVIGRVLEIGDRTYTRQFGGSRVTHSDVLHIDATNPEATIIADLSCADNLADAVFDCVICTQTLQLIYDFPAAVRTLRRILKPSGTALVTVPGISPVAADRWGENWCWSFTRGSAQRVFAECFGQIQVQQFGNVFTAISFLEGLAQEEIRREEMDRFDPQFPVILGIEAQP